MSKVAEKGFDQLTSLSIPRLQQSGGYNNKSSTSYLFFLGVADEVAKEISYLGDSSSPSRRS